MTALAVRDLTVARGGRVLADGLDFAVGRGEAVLVTGENGAGKSSLLRVLAGLLPPAAGVVDRTATIAWLGEAAALDGDRRLGDALRFWAALDGTGNAALRVAGALAAVALDDLGDVPVRLLSTGQRRRAALARVVATGAGLWLLDEPASGLDAATVARLEALIDGHRASGGAVVMTTHQPLAVPDAFVIAL